MCIGQPSEATVGVAEAMIADGLFTRWPQPDFGFAAHVAPRPVGTVLVKDGVVSSASDAIHITFHGVGAHGSMPDKSIDPVMMGSRFVTDVQSIISREKDPKAFGVIRSEERRVGKACVSPCRSRWTPQYYKKNINSKKAKQQKY